VLILCKIVTSAYTSCRSHMSNCLNLTLILKWWGYWCQRPINFHFVPIFINSVILYNLLYSFGGMQNPLTRAILSNCLVNVTIALDYSWTFGNHIFYTFFHRKVHIFYQRLDFTEYFLKICLFLFIIVSNFSGN
jgi:hypothetical protein